MPTHSHTQTQYIYIHIIYIYINRKTHIHTGVPLHTTRENLAKDVLHTGRAQGTLKSTEVQRMHVLVRDHNVFGLGEDALATGTEKEDERRRVRCCRETEPSVTGDHHQHHHQPHTYLRFSSLAMRSRTTPRPQ
jgi:hypothetical protein